ncbi:Glutamine synthetase, type [Elusimicrobium minutum Pei191]|uniref:Glutamine synthetase n=1 Tax=Elusimicrobium minutum (strain Pei191) TaxID=445932 RepID=B2KCS9_ELUMP|nr:type I glutamate--ammonia ligase [Elusimicrobium minutum]ACC98325.1 Glutamine synthetase, type [Elusimicrobium minutum Pei191]
MPIVRTAAELKKIQEILKTAQENNIQFIKIWFVDILGNLKSLAISHREFEYALTEGMGLDGSSIEGFARIYESDLVALPDLDTFTILPEELMGMPVARLFCDIKRPDGKQFEGDTRYILKKNLAEMKKAGFDQFMVGPELEFFYFKDDKNIEPLDKGGYYDSIPIDESHSLRRKTMIMLEKLGIRVEYAHHEVAPSQHEIDLRYDEALKMADNVITYKAVVKMMAEQHGCYATFMPKPMQGQNGSGMHVHQSLFKDGKNTFFDAKDEYYLSPTAKHYIAGVMENVKGIVAITNQWVNSYKRLVPGYEAPVYIAWGRKNRSTLIRIPQVKTGKPNATRIECRFPDPACNPYLAFSVMLAAGLDGIKRKLKLCDPVEDNIFKMTKEERKCHKIDNLPGYLFHAVDALKASDVTKRALGEHTFEKFIANKKVEWDQYRLRITDYEIEKYLPLL